MKTSIVRFVALSVLIILGLLTLFAGSQSGTAQMDPTHQQQTLEAAVQSFFTQTAEANANFAATATLQAAFDQALTATQHAPTLTAEYNATLSSAFQQTLVATQFSGAGLDEVYTVGTSLPLSFRYPSGWAVMGDNAGEAAIISNQPELLSSDISAWDAMIDPATSGMIALIARMDMPIDEAKVQLASLSTALVGSEVLPDAFEAISLNERVVSLLRTYATQMDRDFLFVLVEMGEGYGGILAAAPSGMMSAFEPQLIAMALSIEALEPLPTATPTATEPPPPPAFTIELRIVEIRCSEEQEDRITDVNPFGDEVSMIFQLQRSTSSRRLTGSPVTGRWTAPVSMQAGDVYGGTSFTPITINLMPNEGVNVSFTLSEADPNGIGGDDRFGEYSLNYDSGFVSTWASGSQGEPLRVSEVFENNGFADSYYYTITYEITFVQP